MKPWTVPYLLIPGVTKVVAPTLSPPENDISVGLLLCCLTQNTRLLHSKSVEMLKELLMPALLCHKDKAQGTKGLHVSLWHKIIFVH